MSDATAAVLLYFFVWFVVWVICGIATAAIGSSFWWGFLFGPLGILIAAVLLVGKRPNTIIIQGGRSQVSRRLSDGRIVVRNRDDAMTPRIETEEERFNRLYEAPQRRAESTPPPRPPKRIYIRRK
ncbi:MAG: hypothetical protein GX853_09825 [Chloroflexi bacterium]|nr:hypothetical protein [Chloroflexota bacterium]